MITLTLAHSWDSSALRVHAELRRRLGPSRAWVLSPRQLVLAPFWRHGQDGETTATRIRIADGRVLCDSDIGFVFNRIQLIDVPHFAGARREDRDYAGMEFHSLLLSWLASLPCRVVNPVGPRGINGSQRSDLEWLNLAARAGLSVRGIQMASNARTFCHPSWPAYRLRAGQDGTAMAGAASTRQVFLGRGPGGFFEPVESLPSRVLIVGGRVIGDVPEEMKKGCRRLSELASTPLLSIKLAQRKTGQLCVMAVDPVPELETEMEVEALCDLAMIANMERG